MGEPCSLFAANPACAVREYAQMDRPGGGRDAVWRVIRNIPSATGHTPIAWTGQRPWRLTRQGTGG